MIYIFDISILVYCGGPWIEKCYVYDVCNVVYVMAIWNILWSFDIVFLFGQVAPRKSGNPGLVKHKEIVYLCTLMSMVKPQSLK
jgi:hypothetical protein